jgi:hypothetical protein
LKVKYLTAEIELQKKKSKKLDLQIELLEMAKARNDTTPLTLSQCWDELGCPTRRSKPV